MNTNIIDGNDGVYVRTHIARPLMASHDGVLVLVPAVVGDPR